MANGGGRMTISRVVAALAALPRAVWVGLGVVAVVVLAYASGCQAGRSGAQQHHAGDSTRTLLKIERETTQVADKRAAHDLAELRKTLVRTKHSRDVARAALDALGKRLPPSDTSGHNAIAKASAALTRDSTAQAMCSGTLVNDCDARVAARDRTIKTLVDDTVAIKRRSALPRVVWTAAAFYDLADLSPVGRLGVAWRVVGHLSLAATGDVEFRPPEIRPGIRAPPGNLRAGAQWTF